MTSRTSSSSSIQIMAPPPSTLIPVRIDVTSDDKSIRIVDTLLMDPTCWPVPLYAPLHESLEQNVEELAHTVLSESEVIGMGRTVRHFTGRVDLWSNALQTKIEDQLRPQLWAIVNNTNTQKGLSSVPYKSSSSSSSPVPVHIRLVVHGVVIQEDLLWDPSVPVSALEFAQDMAKEYQLPDEAIVAIVTTILEQVHGLQMDTSVDQSVSLSQPKQGAWRMDSKEHIATVAHMVSQHRPSS
jgi:hypothetical protein